MKEYITMNGYCRQVFGCKVYKLALSASTSCPNRDGTISKGGCIFCSEGGSGDFASSASLSAEQQIKQAQKLLGAKGKGLKYIAYFQSFTGTYGDLEKLEGIYTKAMNQKDIVGLSIATRPDCIDERVLSMIDRLSAKGPVWIELGLQTIHEQTAKLINRGYELPVYDKAMRALKETGVHRITHVILGLPGESKEQMLETVKYAGEATDGIKLQLLHVLKGTALADMYQNHEFDVLTPEEYYEIIADAIELLPPDIVIHRLTGDGPKKDLIAPLWSCDKKRVLADLGRVLRAREIRVKTD